MGAFQEECMKEASRRPSVMAKHRKGNRRVADWMDGNKPIGLEKTLEGGIPFKAGGFVGSERGGEVFCRFRCVGRVVVALETSCENMKTDLTTVGKGNVFWLVWISWYVCS